MREREKEREFVGVGAREDGEEAMRGRMRKNANYNRVMYFMTGFNTVLIAIFNCNR